MEELTKTLDQVLEGLKDYSHALIELQGHGDKLVESVARYLKEKKETFDRELAKQLEPDNV